MQRFICNMYEAEIPRYNEEYYRKIFCSADQSAKLLKPEGDKFFKNLPEEIKENLMIIIQGKETYDYLRGLHNDGVIHIGLRKFDYTDITNMDMCWIEGVRFVFFRHLPSKGNGEIYSKWNRICSPEYEKPPLQRPKVKLAHDCETALAFLKEIEETTQNYISYDYETYNFPSDADFENLCVSFHGRQKNYQGTGNDIAWSINLKAIHKSGKGAAFAYHYGKFLKRIENRLVCFNAEFEPRCTYWELDLTPDLKSNEKFITCLDLWAYVRSLDLKTGNLKYFVQYILKQPSWDDESDELQDKVQKLFNTWETYEDFINDNDHISKKFKTYDEAYEAKKAEVLTEHPDWKKYKLGEIPRWTKKSIDQFFGWNRTNEPWAVNIVMGENECRTVVIEGQMDSKELTKEEYQKYVDYSERFDADFNKWNDTIEDRVHNEVRKRCQNWFDIWDPRYDLSAEYWGSSWASINMEILMTYNCFDSFYTTEALYEVKRLYGNSLDKAARVISNHKLLSSIFQLNGIKMDEAERRKLESDARWLFNSGRLVFQSGMAKIWKAFSKKFPDYKQFKLSKLFDELCKLNKNWYADDNAFNQIVKNIAWCGMPKGPNAEYMYDRLDRFSPEIKSIGESTIKTWWGSLERDENGHCPLNGKQWEEAKNKLLQNLKWELDNYLIEDREKMKILTCNYDTEAWVAELERIMYLILKRFYNLAINNKEVYNLDYFIDIWAHPEKDPKLGKLMNEKLVIDCDLKYNGQDIVNLARRIKEYKAGARKLDHFIPNLYCEDVGYIEALLPIVDRTYLDYQHVLKLIQCDEVISFCEKLGDKQIVDIKLEDWNKLGFDTIDDVEWYLEDVMGKTNSGETKQYQINFLNVNYTPLLASLNYHAWWCEEDTADNIIADFNASMKDYDKWHDEQYFAWQKEKMHYPLIADFEVLINAYRELFGKGDTGIHSIKANSCITDELYNVPYWMSFAYCIYNVMQKEVSTYIGGQNISSSETYIGNDELQNKWSYKDRNLEDYVMLKPAWKVCLVETKRWSSGFHTFPPSCDVEYCWIPESDDRLFFYFDCSQAEVKTCAYKSKDPTILKMYEEGKDIYCEMGKMMYGDQFSKSKHRKMMKSVVLGLLYGRGVPSIAMACGIADSDAQHAVEIFKDMFPVMYQYIQAKIRYAEETGEIETLLGDKVYLRYGDNPKTCGINYFVQGGSALMLGNGFYNCAKSAIDHQLGVLSKGMIHDAYFGTLYAKLVVLLYLYFQKKFTGYIEDTYGITYLYDFELGTNFRDKVHCTLDVNEATLEISGESIYVKKVADIIANNSNGEVTYSVDDFFPDWENPNTEKIERQKLIDSGLEESAAKDLIKKDGRFRLGKPKDSLSGWYTRKSHHFCHENSYMLYPDSTITLKINRGYLAECQAAVNSEEYSKFACNF